MRTGKIEKPNSRHSSPTHYQINEGNQRIVKTSARFLKGLIHTQVGKESLGFKDRIGARNDES